jgi:uncharacterized protein YbjT (DUF2867 family)
MRILITGASGFIGRHFAAALCAAGHEVIAAVRNPSRAKQNIAATDFIAVDFQTDITPDAWLSRLNGIDIVINAVGIISETRKQKFETLHHKTPCALFQACEKSGVKKIIQVSALGADETSTSRYHRTKKAADDCLSALNIDWVILHPSVVYGSGASSSEFFRALSALPIVPLIGNGQQEMQPIHIDDLSQAVVNLLEPGAPSRSHINAVGPTPISFKGLLRSYRQWLGFKETLQVAIPDIFIRLGAQLGQFIPGSLLTPENIQMMSGGNTASVEPFTHKTKVTPRDIDTALKQFSATEADRWHASLFFLRPTLRICIGLLWLATGIISIFIFPIESSYSLLAQLGIGKTLAPFALYGAAGLDIVLGLATLANYRIVTVGIFQILVMFTYIILITIGLPEHWVHPFGAITKNIPLMVATLIMISFERKV